MLKKDFIQLVESVIIGSKNVYNNDKPAIRQLFNDMLDNYNKTGELSDNQANKWILTDRELKHLLIISK